MPKRYDPPKRRASRRSSSKSRRSSSSSGSDDSSSSGSERILRSESKRLPAKRWSDSSTDSSSEDDEEEAFDSDSDFSEGEERGKKRKWGFKLTPLWIVAFGVGLLVLLAFFYLLWRQFGSSSSSSTTPTEANSEELSSSTSSAEPTSPSTPFKTSSATSSSHSSSANKSGKSSSSASTSGSSLAAELGIKGIMKNGIGIGFLPDDASGKGGIKQTMALLNNILGAKSAFIGWYAQLPRSGTWDGSQLLWAKDDIVASGAIFQPAVMASRGGWAGVTASDNSNALAIAKVMKEFTDEGVEVWLRFAHEVNWYQQDGTYTGTPQDFKTAWALVAAAVADNDKVKMFFTPNVANLDVYDKYYPDDPKTVDIIGVDWYPKKADIGKFVQHMQPFYDKYCANSDTFFAMGETGLAETEDVATRIAWLEDMTLDATIKAMPKLVGISWFNYFKDYEFRILAEGDNAMNSVTKKALGLS